MDNLWIWLIYPLVMSKKMGKLWFHGILWGFTTSVANYSVNVSNIEKTCWDSELYMSSVQNLYWLMMIVDYTTRYIEQYPLIMNNLAIEREFSRQK